MTDDGVKKQKQSKIKATAKFLFDVPEWVGTRAIAQNTSWLTTLIRRTFRVRQVSSDGQTGTFTDAMQRIGVSEAELPSRASHFLLNSLIFLALAMGSLGYMAYLWSVASWLVTLAAFVVFCLFSVRAYFYSFCCFQIKRRRLDCSFKEWLFWLFKGGL
jgi:intracellular multiplication protein IcmV